MKTTRFAKIVESSGKPQPYTLWTSPEKDPVFRKALKEDRVMTILHEPTGNKKETAVVGFVEKPNALFLVFPRSLESFRDQRVVGVKYDLLAMPAPMGKPVKASGRKTPAPKRQKEPKPPPSFRVVLRSTSTIELEQQLQAKNASTARGLALDNFDPKAVDFTSGKIATKVVKVSRR